MGGPEIYKKINIAFWSYNLQCLGSPSQNLTLCVSCFHLLVRIILRRWITVGRNDAQKKLHKPQMRCVGNAYFIFSCVEYSPFPHFRDCSSLVPRSNRCVGIAWNWLPVRLFFLACFSRASTILKKCARKRLRTRLGLLAVYKLG